MAILGNIVKGFIDIKNSFSSEREPVKEQLEMFDKLLRTAKNNAFGKYFNFEQILHSENPAHRYSQTVPYFDYNKMHEDWWYRIHEGENDVTWPDHPTYFALSSGTTGKDSK